LIPNAMHKILTHQLREIERVGVVARRSIIRFRGKWNIRV
jgi:hypothetical protein